MFAYKRIVIAQHERGLYLKDRSIKKILAPGVYRIFDPLGRVSVEVYNLTVPEFEHPYIDVLVTEQSALCERHFQVIELKIQMDFSHSISSRCLRLAGIQVGVPAPSRSRLRD